MTLDSRTTAHTIEFARQMRVDILQQIFTAGSGHPGGSMSCADVLACIFATRIDPTALLEDRLDRNHFIMSKGHAAPALYAALAGIGAIERSELSQLRQLGSRLQGHPDRTRLPSVEMSTGSLGQGLSVGAGLSWQMRRQGLSGRVYVLIGDGELDEGQVWEAVALSGVLRLGHLLAIVDANGIQNDGRVEEILDLRPYPQKFQAFGWKVKEIDGQDHSEIFAALEWAEAEQLQPSMILAHTTKGSGVSFMEDQPAWHSHGLTDEQLSIAIAELTAP